MTNIPAIDAALGQHSAGHLAEAEAMYRQILAEHPNHSAALHLLGVALSQQGNKPAAIQYISRAIALDPQAADFHANLGLAYLENGEPQKALATCEQALRLQPDHVNALHHRGNALRQLGRAAESVEPLQRVIALRPDFTMAMGNLADSLRQLGRIAEAEELTDRILARSPDDLSALIGRGEALLRRNRDREAADIFRQAIDKWPAAWVGYNGLGVAVHRLGKFEEATACYHKAADLAPEQPGPWNNLGYALVTAGRLEQGIEFYHKSLALRADYADALTNLGNAYLAKLDLDSAMHSYLQALYHQPDHRDAHWNRALLELLRGNFDRGWVEYEWRWHNFPEFRRYFRQPLWNGFDIAGKTILLHAEQGFGDTIQFIRLAPLVAERGATVNLECPRELEPLLQHLDGVARTFSREDSLPPFDVHCPLLSLPYALGLSMNNIPGRVPYLQVNENLVRRWARRLEPYRESFKVGIVWAGARIHRRDAERSIKSDAFEPLAKIDGVRLFSLQKERVGPPAGFELTDFTADLHDFAETAALMMNLDLVIGVDTAVIHLAGALGRQVWTLLAFSPDWRWMLNRQDSPWYPSMRLFRQPRPGDWAEVIRDVRQVLTERLDAG